MKSEFLTHLDVEQITDSEWRLTQPLIYTSERLNRTITVPAGFVTDFASVPRLPLVYWMAGGTADKAAVIHDLLYRQSGVSRCDADAVFVEAMTVSGQVWWRRAVMWAGLRVFGWSAYKSAPDDSDQPSKGTS